MILANATGTFTDPTDNTAITDDTNLTDGSGAINVTGSSTSYSWTNASAGTHYYFKIYAYGTSAQNYYTSGTPATVNAYTLALEPTKDVTGFSVSGVTGTSVTVSWTNQADGNRTNYVILANTTGTFTDPTDNNAISDDTNLTDGSGAINVLGSATSYSWTNASSSTTYYFKIYAYASPAQNYYTSGTPATANGETLAPEPTKDATGFSVSAVTATSINVSWTNQADANRTNYVILANTTGTFTDPTDNTAITDDTNLTDGSGAINVAGSATTYSWTNASAATHYYFKIYAYGTSPQNYYTSGTPATSNGFTLSTEPSNNVSTINNGTITTTSIDLSWSAATGANGYIILIATGGSAPAATNLTDGTDPTGATGYKANVTSTSTTISGLSVYTTYSFTVVPYAWDGANAGTYNFRTSDASTLTSITTLGIVPTVTTDNVSSITDVAATVQGNISATGTPSPTARGILFYTYDGTDKILTDGGITTSEDTPGPYSTGTFTKNLTLVSETQ